MALEDTGERMIPPSEGEVSFVWTRHRFAYAHAASFCEGKRVLDVGCGTGYGSHLLAESAKSVLGIDNSAAAIDYCRERFVAPNLTYQVRDASKLSEDAAFDVALSFQVIEHLADPVDFLRRLRDAVVPGGLVLVTTPNVRKPAEQAKNPYHLSEMSAAQFSDTARAVFPEFELHGIGYRRPNRIRSLIQRTPLYKLGKAFRRTSVVKRAANRMLDLTAFEFFSDKALAKVLQHSDLARPSSVRSPRGSRAASC